MKRFLSLLLVALLAFTGLGLMTSELLAEDDVIEVTFPTFLSGENVGAKFFLPQVERFNELYEGKYKLIVEEVPQAAYAEKIKQLALQNKLPVLIHSPGSGGIDRQWFDQVAVPNKMAHDLSGVAEAHPELMEYWMKPSIDVCTYDGELLIKPRAIMEPVGLFYNETMLDLDKDIKDMTVDEFLAMLKDQDQKVALMTAENAWTTGLLLSAFIANEEGGAEFLNEHSEDKLYDFTDERIVKGLAEIQQLFQESAAANSLGAAYADAANAFMSKQAAVIANGPWMTGDFSEEGANKWSNGFSSDQVKATIYPGNVALGNEASFGEFWVSANASPEEIELAEAFIAFRDSQPELEALMLAEGGTAPNLEYSDEFIEAMKQNRLLSELTMAMDDETIYSENILGVMPSSVADVEFGKLLPKLVDGSMTPEEFAQELTKKAEEAR